jgi:hypothetical protein
VRISWFAAGGIPPKSRIFEELFGFVWRSSEVFRFAPIVKKNTAGGVQKQRRAISDFGIVISDLCRLRRFASSAAAPLLAVNFRDHLFLCTPHPPVPAFAAHIIGMHAAAISAELHAALLETILTSTSKKT